MTAVFPRELVFEAILDGGVMEALPSLLADVCGARSAWFHWSAGDGGISLFADNGYFPDDYTARYAAEFAVDDPWLMAARRKDKVNAFWDYSEVVSDASFENSRIWNEMAQPSGDDTFFCMGAILTTCEGQGAVALHRGRAGGRFGEDAARAMQGLARDLRFMFAARAAMTEQASHGHAMIVTDGRRVTYANAAAEACLAQREVFRIVRGRLVAEGPSQSLFDDALAACLPPLSRASAICLRQPDHDLSVSLTPLMPQANKALIRFRPPANPGTLTRRESQVLTLVAQGGRIDAIAYTLGLSRPTVEFHLAAVRRKLGAATLVQAVAIAVKLGVITV